MEELQAGMLVTDECGYLLGVWTGNHIDTGPYKKGIGGPEIYTDPDKLPNKKKEPTEREKAFQMSFINPQKASRMVED